MKIEYTLERAPRSDCIEAFMAWLGENKVDTSGVKVHEFKEGLGLQAQKPIQVIACLIKKKYFAIFRYSCVT